MAPDVVALLGVSVGSRLRMASQDLTAKWPEAKDRLVAVGSWPCPANGVWPVMVLSQARSAS